MDIFHKLHIKEIKHETADAVSVVFDIPNSLKDNFTFKAGQYLTLKTTLNNTDVRRAYSICSAPNSGELRVAIKRVENGVFSTYATTQLTTESTIEVAEPEGRFLLNPEANKNYIAFAAGSGITPILAMVKTVLTTEPTATFTLVYGNKTVKDTIFYEALNDLQAAYPKQFNLHYIFTREQVTNSLRGRIDENVAKYFLKNRYKDTAFNSAFLCGPEEMITTVSKTLETFIAKEHIYFELFVASTDSAKEAQVKEGTTAVTLILDDEEETFNMAQTDTILAASLRNDLDPPYSCQGGVCSSCLAKVTEGKAVMVANSILTDSEVAEGLVLTCKAHPTTPTITVDFDDV